MSLRDVSPPPQPPPELTFKDAIAAGPGEARRRILEQIKLQDKRRLERLQAMTRATMYATPERARYATNASL